MLHEELHWDKGRGFQKHTERTLHLGLEFREGFPEGITSMPIILEDRRLQNFSSLICKSRATGEPWPTSKHTIPFPTSLLYPHYLFL